MAEQPRAKKSLGQHWLNDQAALQAICDAADLNNKATVLEIGPGPGGLTGLLVRGAGRVIAVELDAKLARELPEWVKADNLRVINEDILSFDFTSLPAGYKLVANIPYYLTGKLIQIISETDNPPTLAVLLLQKEVARRLAAKPGAMSILSVTAQYYWEVSLDREVPARAFTPPPKVDSQVLILRRRPEPLFADLDVKQFFRLIKTGFAQPRKTLLNNLSSGLRLTKEEVVKRCAAAHLDSSRRAQTLSLNEWHELYRAINP